MADRRRSEDQGSNRMQLPQRIVGRVTIWLFTSGRALGLVPSGSTCPIQALAHHSELGVPGSRLDHAAHTLASVGTDSTIGRKLIRHRQRRSSPSGGAEPFDVPAQGQRIDSADVGQLADSSSAELVKQINTCAARIRYAPILGTFFALVGFMYLVGASRAEQSAIDAYSSAAKAAEERSQAAEKAYQAF